jgi:Tfp pilus assembly protein PilW
MNAPNRCQHRRRGSRSSRSGRRRGLGIAEALISLAIAATLLTAVAVAYAATNNAMQANDEFTRANQAARVTVNRIVADVRKCTGVGVDTTELEVTRPAGDRALYAYDAANKRATVKLLDAPGEPTYKLVDNVTAMKFSTDGDAVSVTIRVARGDNSVTLNGSAMPRRVAAFN